MRRGFRWSNGVGSSQRSRKVCATSPTAGPPDFELNVVPRRSIAVLGVEVDCLRVALVPGVVVSAVTEVDPADEGDVVVGS